MNSYFFNSKCYALFDIFILDKYFLRRITIFVIFKFVKTTLTETVRYDKIGLLFKFVKTKIFV